MTEMGGILDGILLAFTLENLLVCLIGVAIGTMVGVLPGLGPVAGISMLLPITMSMEPATALIFVSGIYFGGMYGGATTSILVNIPGDATSVVTCIDGYPMAQKGRAGAALVISALASFVAGTIGVVGLSFLAPMLANFALKFGPPEYFAIVLVGMLALARMTDSSVVRSFLMIAAGVVLSLVGMDTGSGMLRLTFDSKWLIDGLDFIPVIMGLYGMSGILSAMESTFVKPIKADLSFKQLLPSKEELRRSTGPAFRGGILGFLIGLVPGPSSIISTFTSYKIERQLSKRKEEFGKGAVEGVAGPEAANNGASTGTLVPLLSLGIPFSPLPAVLLTAFMLHGITPGPMLMSDHPTLFWALIASMYIGNILLLVLNVPLVGLFAKVAYIQPKVLMPLIMVFCFIGAYSVNYNMFDLVLLMVFGVIGYLLNKANMDPSPLILGMVLGPVLEMNFAQSLIIFRGDLTGFFSRGFSGTILIIGILVVLYPAIRRGMQYIWSKRSERTDGNQQ